MLKTISRYRNFGPIVNLVFQITQIVWVQSIRKEVLCFRFENLKTLVVLTEIDLNNSIFMEYILCIPHLQNCLIILSEMFFFYILEDGLADPGKLLSCQHTNHPTSTDSTFNKNLSWILMLNLSNYCSFFPKSMILYN